MNAHIQKKEKKYIKEKFRYNDQFLIIADEIPPKQHQKFVNSKSDMLKKSTVHKRYHRPDQRSWIFTLEKVHAHKIMHSTTSLSGTTN
jgi:hypothetical protein